MLKAVIFDMDGVIIDSEPQHTQAAILALQIYGITAPREYIESFVGSTTYYMCQQMIKEFDIKVTAEELLQANNDMKAYLLERDGHTVVPYIIDLMKDLHQNGIKLIIASSSSSEAIEEVMDSLNIRQYFEGYISGMNVTYPKPAPDIFLKAAEILGVNPSECVVIEDSHHGVRAARAAGMTCIGFLNPNSGNQDLSQTTFLVEGFDEVDYQFVNRVYQYEHMEPVTVLSTKRCILRELSIDRFDELFELNKSNGINEHLKDYSGDYQIEKEKLAAYIQNVYHFYGFGLLGIFLKENDKLIGRCGIEYKTLEDETVYELGYYLHPDYQGRGLATEVLSSLLPYYFKSQDISRIVARIHETNLSSIRLAERIGMSRYGKSVQGKDTYIKYEIMKNKVLGSEGKE